MFKVFKVAAGKPRRATTNRVSAIAFRLRRQRQRLEMKYLCQNFRLEKLERAKGFEPSTFTLAT